MLLCELNLLLRALSTAFRVTAQEATETLDLGSSQSTLD